MKYLLVLETATESACKILRWWVLKQTGINWDDCIVTGIDDAAVRSFAPTVAIITLDPDKLRREVTPLTLAIEDMRKARDFAGQGQRVMVLCGGKAAKHYLGYGSNANKLRGHYTTWPLTTTKMTDSPQRGSES